MKPIAILGVGPAGLMAAHAVALHGRPVAMFGAAGRDGNIQKSRLGGAQFLHDPLPGINDEECDANVQYRVVGDPETYKRKVYGDTQVPYVSMEHVYDGKLQPAWNLRRTYDKLWDFLNVPEVGNVQHVTPAWIDHAFEQGWFDAVLSTIPAPALCRSADFEFSPPHQFISQKITIADEAMHEDEHNIIHYNGTTDQSWYRSSTLFGYGSTEWGPRVVSVLPNTITVTKPLRTNCDCFKDQVVRLGRFGTWTKGVLTHHAYAEAVKVMELGGYGAVL